MGLNVDIGLGPWNYSYEPSLQVIISWIRPKILILVQTKSAGYKFEYLPLSS